MDEEDVVVEEIPVFLSKNLQDNLFLFQYPTKSHTGNFEKESVLNCRVKPLNREVKIDFGLNTESRFYDHFKGEQLALAADGKSPVKGERLTFKRGIMDKHTFISSCSMENASKYVVGIFNDKEVHLTPLTSILQLRPSFSHIEKEDKRHKAEQKALNDEDGDGEELQQVTVKFARTGANGRKIRAGHGYDTLMKQSGDEPWCETFWHVRSTPTAELERQKLFATNQHHSHALTLGLREYITKLKPKKAPCISDLLPSPVISKVRLQPLTLPEQLKVLLKDTKMIRFDDIVVFMQDACDPNVPAEKILRTLPQVGMLVHGNWVLQSELLYPADTFSDANGVAAEALIRARNYILFRFARSTCLYRRQVFTAVQLPPQEALEVLQSVARLNSEKKWELIQPPDKEFEQRVPELVQRQDMLWSATEYIYLDMDHEKSPKRTRKRSVREAKVQHHLPPPSASYPAQMNTTFTA